VLALKPFSNLPTLQPSFVQSLLLLVNPNSSRPGFQSPLYLRESKNFFLSYLGRFRPGRSKIDQVLLLSQSIWEGFQKKSSSDRTVLATIDFSKAFDSVWYSGLFYKLLVLGLQLALFAVLGPFCQTKEQRSSSMVLDAARSKSDVVSLKAQSLARPSSSYTLTTLLGPTPREPITHSMLMIMLSGSPPLIH